MEPYESGTVAFDLFVVVKHVAVIFLLIVFASSQVSFTKAGDASASEPKLPVVDDKACPGPSSRVDGVVEPVPVTVMRSAKLCTSTLGNPNGLWSRYSSPESK